MGCPRLTYREKGERLNFLGLWKKGDGSKSGEDYYPGGATFNSYARESSVPNKYLYQDKEYVDDLGLNLDDFGPRMYDPFINRTTSQDPHAENYYAWSPYSWENGNPISNIDPTGMDVIETANGTSFTGADAQAAFMQLQSMFQQQENGNNDAGGGGDDKDKKKKDDKKKDEQKTDDKDKKDDKKEANALPLALVVTTEVAVETPALPFAIAGAAGWKTGEAIGENVDPISEGIATVLEWFGVASETLRGPSQLDAHKKKKQSTGGKSNLGRHQKGEARDRQKDTDKKRQKDDWNQNPNKRK